MKRYEAMFLFDTAVTRDWAEIEAEVRRLCDRIEAELLVCVKFDERKLAYEVEKRRRGTYVLTYIDAPPERIVDLERDVQLSEMVLRVLVLRAENLTEERLAELRAHPADQPLTPLAPNEGRRYDDRGDRGGRGGRDDRRRYDRGDRSEGDGKREQTGEQGGQSSSSSEQSTTTVAEPEEKPGDAPGDSQ